MGSSNSSSSNTEISCNFASHYTFSTPENLREWSAPQNRSTPNQDGNTPKFRFHDLRKFNPENSAIQSGRIRRVTGPYFVCANHF
ncbi:hypothetical protein Bxe_A0585 [Paraburkholderia xenovorans LB400]|uniref:Uncharacterized protein n=1 Tax=Paraburkholderia xenovorans (strain LB400) TaxID=266265 RepID=Q13U91_PARXL|nr:hypothetical protein Bxe_A0585 [Paraburkholderia xenovorans LB400]